MGSKNVLPPAIILAVSTASYADAPNVDLSKPKVRTSYSLGYQVGLDLQQQGLDLNREAMRAGLVDGRAGHEPRVPADEMQSLLEGLKTRILRQRAEAKLKEAASAKEFGRKFLAQNRTKEGVVSTESGLQYRVVKPGNGPSPGPRSRVKVHYVSRSAEGHEFFNTRKRKEPATFRLDGVIRGWSEGLQLMKPGAVYELFIPTELAFNERGPLAHKTIIMEVELLDVLAEESPAKETRP